MKVHYLKEPLLREEYIDVHYREEAESVEIIRNFFSSFNSIIGKKDDCMQKLHPGSIYYLEVLNRSYKKSFLDALYHVQEVCHETDS